MNDDLYDELLESVREGGAILRGEKEPSRSWTVDEPHVAELRAHYGLSQERPSSPPGRTPELRHPLAQLVQKLCEVLSEGLGKLFCGVDAETELLALQAPDVTFG